MKNLTEFKHKIKFVLTDIDDTLTSEGSLPSIAYEALWKLHDAGIKIIPTFALHFKKQIYKQLRLNNGKSVRNRFHYDSRFI